MEIFGINVVYLVIIGIVTYLLYDWLQLVAWKHKYNIKGPFIVPLVGTLVNAFIRTTDDTDALYHELYGPVYGGLLGSIKMMHVADVDILKKVLVKDHLKFQNRFSLARLDPKPLDKSLMSLKEGHWKRVRSTLTPSYSPGKIKMLYWPKARRAYVMMLQEIKYAAKNLVSGLEEKAQSGEPVDSKFNFGCYSMDVIAGTAFGIRTDARKNPDQPFISLAKKVFGQDPFKNPMMLVSLIFPRFGMFMKDVLNVKIFYPLDSLNFFMQLILDIMKARRSEGITDRNDLLQLMMNAQNDGDESSSKNLTEDELLAQGFLVFIAGYETTASLLTYLSYALATHPEIQDKLIAEIDSVIKTDSDMSYDKIMEMPYLDQVVCETLRMYPPVTRMNRTTSEHQDVEVDGHWFPKDTLISFSIWQIHHQLGLYPEPEKFIPERFTPEEKQKRDPFTFIPFGHGPRNCIGMRLALLEAKVGIVEVLRKLKFVKIPETEEKLQVIVQSFLMTKNPVKVGVTLR